ncbi:hypothetical protein PVAG01_02350 [Phlyctema vagabunda]|uniref:Uncharacterized protein n=1 Tax=Phlyctema vagabunda TaxID=108571 RepID=A0ABR4PQW0_9HELO
MPTSSKPTKTFITRLLILTHHITSRKKLHAVTLFSNSCSLLIKSGKPPGIFLCEFSSPNPPSSSSPSSSSSSPSYSTPSPVTPIDSHREDAERWLEKMRRLRYKDFRVALREELVLEPGDSSQRLARIVPKGEVMEVRENLKEFAGLVDSCDEVDHVNVKGRVRTGAKLDRETLGAWWRRGMGWAKE